MGKKTSCDNTDYTDGFKITTEANGTFTAVKGKTKLNAGSAKEINELIKKLKDNRV
jgi:hypothetical protein